MKILVIGTGSIGRRHLANLVRLGHEVGYYSYRQTPPLLDTDVMMRLEQDPHRLHHPPAGIPLADLGTWIQTFDGVVIANRTDLHLETALMIAALKRPMYLEKPLSHQMEQVDTLVQRVRDNQLVVEGGFMLRQHPNLKWITQWLHEGHLGLLYYARAAVGQWLPDWRPGTDHRQGYGAFRRFGGGVVFDLIHEIDVVQWLIGSAHHVTALTRHLPELEIETEAVAQIGLCTHTGVLASIHLDYVRPAYGRSLELVGQHGVLTWDYVAGQVFLQKRCTTTPPPPPEWVHQVEATFQRNDLFIDMMRHFIHRIENSSLTAASSLDDSVQALKVALACHQSAQTGQRITIHH